MLGMTQPHSAVQAAVTEQARTRDGRTILFTRDDNQRRYMATVDGDEAAVCEYLLTDDLVIFSHTITKPAFEGQGVASSLVKWALDDVRRSARHLLAVCPFVKAFVERHEAEYADLLYHADPAATQGVSVRDSDAEAMPSEG